MIFHYYWFFFWNSSDPGGGPCTQGGPHTWGGLRTRGGPRIRLSMISRYCFWSIPLRQPMIIFFNRKISCVFSIITIIFVYSVVFFGSLFKGVLVIVGWRREFVSEAIDASKNACVSTYPCSQN